MKNIAKFTRQSFARQNLGGIIDQTNIRDTATATDIKKTCQEARDFRFRGVCVKPKWVKLVKKELNPVRDYKDKKELQRKQISNGVKGMGIKIVCLIDPPIGDSSHQKRIKICQKAKRDGADELDVVISIPDVKHGRWNKILKDLKEICKILPTKVIIGSGYLTDEEIKKASEIGKKARAICVKTATEKDPLERRELKEKFYHLKIMKKAALGLLIKASGNVKTLNDIKEAIKAGADIVGTSSGVEIMEEFKNKD